jgi:pyruvate kinase
MSRHRIHIPIYALTPKLATQRKMALYRNVRPLLMDQSADTATPKLLRRTSCRGAPEWVRRGIVCRGG